MDFREDDLTEYYTNKGERVRSKSGVYFGEGNSYGIRKVMRLSTTYNIMISIIISFILFAIAHLVPNLYGIETPQIREASIYAVRVLAITFVTNSIIHIWIKYFPRIKQVLLGNVVVFFYSFFTPLCCAIPLGILYGFKGMVWGFSLSLVLTVVIISAYIIKKYK